MSTRSRLRTVGVGIAVVGCNATLTPMIDYSVLEEERHARFFADETTIAVQAKNPQGMNLVIDTEPALDHGRVVLVAGLTSSGSENLRTYCCNVRPLHPPADWASQVYWRNIDRELVQVQPIERGEEARRVLADCH